jgi:SNF2 family DNA or RNA helicase
MDYSDFIEGKSQLDGNYGFDPIELNSYLFPFQEAITKWAVRKGRGAIFADCGLGKTIMELDWGQNVYLHTGKPVLIITPLAVGKQFVTEADKFGFEVARAKNGEIKAPIVITNYERLHYFDSDKFGGVVCDESSILKSFDGIRKAQITEFMRLHKYRLLGTATAAPNDYTELGTSSEALGYLGYMDMLGRFFTNRQRTTHMYHGKYQLKNNSEWRFKGHAELAFWRWVASWARALRKPSDMGFSDDGFDLPPLNINQHVVKARQAAPGMLLNIPAVGLKEQRQERRRTLPERCEMVASLVKDTGKKAVVWCALNDEGDLLERLIPDAHQVSGKDSDDAKEARFEGFSNGEIRVLITKPKIGAWGLNWQHCNHVTFFPSHSYEQYYQAVRRCWRFGQERPVTVDIVATEGEVYVQENLQRKADQAAEMFTALVAHMNDSYEINRLFSYNKEMEAPSWLS